MQLTLQGASKTVGGEVHLHPLDLTLQPGAVNVVLGASQAGKTTLLRLMAGLDRPGAGRILADGRDVTGLSVRKRDVAMVYQQFINYPSLTVFENIASPLRNGGRPAAEIAERVSAMARTLHLEPFLARLPAQLSGGQQQRTALARALIKGAGLLLLDEPLSNLDYKLREELRLELAALFASGRTTVVYATADPQEALQLGGHTAVLHEGRLLQQGPTAELFARPASLAVARTFSDPPLNVLPALWQPTDGSGRLQVAGSDVRLGVPPAARARLNQEGLRELTVAIRPYRLKLGRPDSDGPGLDAQVDLAEISGSETFLHVSRGDLALVLQLPGVQALSLGTACRVLVDPEQLYGFFPDGRLLFAPGEERA
jgi:glycerol transport system ATP-binding protein